MIKELNDMLERNKMGVMAVNYTFLWKNIPMIIIKELINMLEGNKYPTAKERVQ